MENVGVFLPTETPIPAETSIIKVIGVGGGGSNAVNYMYMQGIEDVSFVVCNTDHQDLQRSPVPTKLQLGATITKGLGAGGRPERARTAALESLPEIEMMLSDGTEMVFITAGMGGGTGTGAAPVIAKTAKEQGILTVGIVTIPFVFEGRKKFTQALAGVEEMSKYVDAILVIHNEKLKQMFPDFELLNAFAKADDVLANAARGIAEMITIPGYPINLDFADVKTVMQDSNVAVMNTGYAEGENRITNAIKDALVSPLLEDIDIREAKKILLNVYYSRSGKVTMEELDEINQFTEKMDDDVEVIWGTSLDETLGDAVKVTLVATGFSLKTLPGMAEVEESNKKEVIALDDEPKTVTVEKTPNTPRVNPFDIYKPKKQVNVLTLEDLDNDDRLDELSRKSAYSRKHGDTATTVAKPPMTDLSKLYWMDENGEVKEKNSTLFNNPD
ncbi:MAG: cell division protein FtsZ [Prevotellaceae bacterium]|jgi:cell division protein FtsZ|nr:cell division protein FtsZ [Prevotellaceae bacterium]